MQTALLFSTAQLNLIIIIAIVFAVLFAANSVLLVLFFHKRKKSKLCTDELQRRREELLEELAQLRFFTPQEEGDEELSEMEEIDDLEDDAVEEFAYDDAEGDNNEEADEAYGEILAVKDMSALMRERFGFVSSEFDIKRYYVRYVYGFGAKLLAANDEIKNYYVRIMDKIGLYGDIRTRRSFRHERIYTGRKTLGMLLFKGKTLCIALALNPADYADTKYRGKDVAHVKRFGATPMLVRITSARKLKYVLHLLEELAQICNVKADNPNYNGMYDLGEKSAKELFALDLMKIIILGEAEDGDAADVAEEDDEIAMSGESRFKLKVLAVKDMSALMRKNLGFVGDKFDKKRYYVSYSYGFEAKLRSSSEEVKQRYMRFMDEVGLYQKLTVVKGFRQQRLSLGRKTVGLILFKGKTLCVALALNPHEYETTKYRGIDVSEIKRFEKTPMLVKITSSRRLTYARYLLNRLAENYLIAMRREPLQCECSTEELSPENYYAEGLIKIKVIGEVPEGVSAD